MLLAGCFHDGARPPLLPNFQPALSISVSLIPDRRPCSSSSTAAASIDGACWLTEGPITCSVDVGRIVTALIADTFFLPCWRR